MNQAPLAVRASGLVKRYGDVLAVDGLDLEIPAGQFFGLLGPNGGVGYQRFLIPGVLGMSMLFGAMLAALSMVYDKESGVMRMLIVAPFPHYWIVIAKMLAAALAAILKAVSLANPYTSAWTCSSTPRWACCPPAWGRISRYGSTSRCWPASPRRPCWSRAGGSPGREPTGR